MDAKQITPEVEAIAKQAWDSGHRIAMQIAALPASEREKAIEAAKRILGEVFDAGGATPEQRDGFIAIQIQLIRGVIQKIDAGGSPQGGRA
jgi:hypothetical protein